MSNQELWEKTLSFLKKEISDAAFKTWFAKTRLLKNEGQEFEVICASSFAKNKIETVHKENLLRILSELTGAQAQLKVSVSKEVLEFPNRTKGIERPLLQPLENPVPLLTVVRPRGVANLSPHYRFENFVIGSNNRLAYAMATAVSKSPGANANNPFFLYASVGLGKTHLVQALGNEIIKRAPSLRVLYTTSENFTNELIESIQHRTQNNFRRKFRDVDVLIIDDIQFIAGRESTQEEFFHTFNALYLAQKQIILTSDRHPREISRLEDRLTSRFGGGITADIQNPDFETRLAILQTKMESLNLQIDGEILNSLASFIQTNIRELEGGLKQVVNLMIAQNGQIELDQVKNLFSDRYQNQNNKNTDPKKIIRQACEYFGLREPELLSQRRTQALVRPRQIIMFLLRKVYQLPLVEVGRLLGGRDHTTIMYGVAKIEKDVQTDTQIKLDLTNLQRGIEENS